MIVLSAVCYGAVPVFVRTAYAAGTEPYTLLFLRFLIASIVMLGILLLRRRSFPRRAIFLKLAGIGALFFAGQSMAYYYGLSVAPAGLVALLFFLFPVFATLLSAVIFKEAITRLKLLCLALALAGGALTVNIGNISNPLGAVLGLVSAFLFASYIVSSSRVMKQVSPIPATTVIILSAGVVYSGIMLVRGPQLPVTPLGWIAVLCVALVSTVAAILLFLKGLDSVDASVASTLSTVEPATALLLSALVLKESITPFQIMGGVLILAAVIILGRGEKYKEPAVELKKELPDLREDAL